MAGPLRYLLALVAVIVAACVAEPAKTSIVSQSGDRPVPVLDQGMPAEVAFATFALG